MNKSKKYFKIAAILNLAIGILSLKLIFYSSILIISGLFIYILSINEKDYKKELLYILGFIMLPLNIISAVLIFIGIDKMKYLTNNNSPPTTKELPSQTIRYTSKTRNRNGSIIRNTFFNNNMGLNSKYYKSICSYNFRFIILATIIFLRIKNKNKKYYLSILDTKYVFISTISSRNILLWNNK